MVRFVRSTFKHDNKKNKIISETNGPIFRMNKKKILFFFNKMISNV